jgi:hypothetical protein
VSGCSSSDINVHPADNTSSSFSLTANCYIAHHIKMNPLPPYPFTPAPIPAVFPKDTVDPSVAAEQEKIRAELDSRLTRWTGPSENLGGLGEKESGIPGNGWWMEDIGGKGVAEWGGLAFDILFKLRNYKDYK